MSFLIRLESCNNVQTNFCFLLLILKKMSFKNSVNPDLENLKHLMNDMIESLSAKKQLYFYMEYIWGQYYERIHGYRLTDNQLTWYPKPEKNTFF